MRAQDLPKHGPGETLDFEPKLMLDGPHGPPAQSKPAALTEEQLEVQVRQLEAVLTRAEQSAVEGEQLYKDGILAKVEAEDRVMRVVKVRKELADAKLVTTAGQVETVEKAFAARTGSQADLDAANTALKAAQAAATAAEAEWTKAQIDAAALDLKRKRKLYAEGVGSRKAVEMAEDRLALLSGTAGVK